MVTIVEKLTKAVVLSLLQQYVEILLVEFCKIPKMNNFWEAQVTILLLTEYLDDARESLRFHTDMDDVLVYSIVYCNIFPLFNEIIHLDLSFPKVDKLSLQRGDFFCVCLSVCHFAFFLLYNKL